MGEKTIDQEKLNKFMNDGWSWRDYSGGQEDNTFILVDEAGVEYPAVLTDETVELTATENDLRMGKTALNDDGVLTGEKEIPSYYTTEGQRLVMNGSRFEIPFNDNKHEYTKLQALICTWNTNMSDSVSTEKVVIDGNVYAVRSIEPESSVTVTNKPNTIDLGIVNSFGAPCILRYFTYKEVY